VFTVARASLVGTAVVALAVAATSAALKLSRAEPAETPVEMAGDGQLGARFIDEPAPYLPGYAYITRGAIRCTEAPLVDRFRVGPMARSCGGATACPTAC
jgi:hypothetical protein